VCAGRTLSHAELWSMAGAAAQHLGGTVGTIGAVGTVAILLERGISMVLLAQLRRQTTKATQEQIQQYRHQSKRYVLHRKVCNSHETY